MTLDAKWRITFPISKSEAREDGLYLIGEATGPEVDLQKERMHPSAIAGFEAQINERVEKGDPIPYRDAHAKDGVMRDLGWITKGWLNPNGHLGIEVKLDTDNPAANYLYQQIQKGKQFGMSVFGFVRDFVDEWVGDAGSVVRTYKSVLLDEVSNTTRPVWTPSFGTVLSKAIDEALEAESVAKGENTSMHDDELQQVQDPQAPADAVTTEKSDEAAPAEDAVEKAAEDAAPAETTEKAVEEEAGEAEVEKAGRRISMSTAGNLREGYSSLQSAINEFGRRLAELGVLDPEDAHSSVDEGGVINIDDDNPMKSDSEPAENAVTKSEQSDETDLRTQVMELQKALSEATAAIEELRKNPAAPRPVLISKAENDVIDPMAVIAQMSPSERLRLGLAARHPGAPR